MKIILGIILFIIGSLWLEIIIAAGVSMGLKIWEKQKDENN